jgi:hypothetical protein
MIRLKAARLMAEAVAAQQQLDGLVARIGFALSELDIRAREYDSLRQEINPQQSRQ